MPQTVSARAAQPAPRITQSAAIVHSDQLSLGSAPAAPKGHVPHDVSARTQSPALKTLVQDIYPYHATHVRLASIETPGREGVELIVRQEDGKKPTLTCRYHSQTRVVQDATVVPELFAAMQHVHRGENMPPAVANAVVALQEVVAKAMQDDRFTAQETTQILAAAKQLKAKGGAAR